MNKIFCQNLKKLRTDNDLLQRELAAELNFSAAQIIDWETGRSKPNIEQLEKITSYFNISADELLGIEPIQKKPAVFSDEDSELLEIYHNASDTDKIVIRRLLATFKDSKNKQKKA